MSRSAFHRAKNAKCPCADCLRLASAHVRDERRAPQVDEFEVDPVDGPDWTSASHPGFCDHWFCTGDYDCKPNLETRQAMAELERGEGKRFTSVPALMTDLFDDPDESV